MHILLLKELLLLIIKKITTDDIESPNNTAANANASNTANGNAFGEKKLALKTMHHLSIVFQKLMV